MVPIFLELSFGYIPPPNAHPKDPGVVICKKVLELLSVLIKDNAVPL